MTDITPVANCILEGLLEKKSCLMGRHRVLWVRSEVNLIVTIAIPEILSDKAFPSYFPSPIWRELETVRGYLVTGDIKFGERPTIPGYFLHTDAQLKSRFSPCSSKFQSSNESDLPRCLVVRDLHMSWISPILQTLEKSRIAFFENNGYTSSIKAAAEACNQQENKIRSAINKYFSLDIGNNALLPGFFRCGGKAKSRKTKDKNGRLGRPHPLSITGNWRTKGFVPTEDDKKKIGLGWKMFMDGKCSKEKAFIKCASLWWNEGYEQADGVARPKLLSQEYRPTISQFNRWGPTIDGGLAASELLINKTERAKKHRPMVDSSVTPILGIGQLGSIDATRLDVTAVSTLSVLTPISQGWVLDIGDCLSDLINGFYLGFDAPSERMVTLALYHAATNKDEQFKRFKVAASPEHIPPRFFSHMRSDNGESKNIGTMTTLLGAGILQEFVPKGRADLNGTRESAHGSMHALFDHTLSGTTQGRKRNRGEDATAISACWNWSDLMWGRLTAVAYRNAQQDAAALIDRLPFRSEMLRDPSFKSTRLGIDQWCCRNGYDARVPLNTDLLRVRLLPVLRARVNQTGVWLIRPDTGDKTTLVKGLRYAGQRSIDLGWHSGKTRKISRKKYFDIDVHYDPGNLLRIWFTDDEGVHELQNRHPDWVLPRDCCLQDVLALQDHESLKRHLDANAFDQAQSDYLHDIYSMDTSLQKDKANAIGALLEEPSKNSLTENQGKNKSAEIEILAATVDPLIQALHSQEPERHPEQPDMDAEQGSDQNDSLSSSDSYLDAALDSHYSS